jgi:hypothetical protein
MSNLTNGGQAPTDEMAAIADSIISQAYLSDLPAADQQYLKDTLVLQLSRRLGSVIMENLSEAGQAEYAALLADGPVPDPAKLQSLLDKFIPDYPAKIKTGLDEFIKQAVASLSK